MSREAEARLGPVAGRWAERRDATVSAPCEHQTIYKNRLLRSDLLIIVHGAEDGTCRVTEHEVR